MRTVSRRLDELPGLPYQGQKFSILKISDVFQSLAWLAAASCPLCDYRPSTVRAPSPRRTRGGGCTARHDWVPLAAGSPKRTANLWGEGRSLLFPLECWRQGALWMGSKEQQNVSHGRVCSDLFLPQLLPQHCLCCRVGGCCRPARWYRQGGCRLGSSPGGCILVFLLCDIT